MPFLEPIEPSLFADLLGNSDTLQGNRLHQRISEQSIDFQLALAQDPNTPPEILKVLVERGDKTVAEAAALHVNLAGELTTDWQLEIDKILETVQLGQNDRLAVELLKIGSVPPELMSRWIPPDKLIQALTNPYVTKRDRLKFLARLAEETTVEPRLIAAESLDTPLSVLEKLLGDVDLAVRLATQNNPNCPAELADLVDAEAAIAKDWNSDPVELVRLSQSRWDAIRLAVAQNPSTPEASLRELANDSTFEIQLAVAKNPATSGTVLSILAEHPEQAVRSALAVHWNATEEILHQVFPTTQGLIEQRKDLPSSILQRSFDERSTDVPLWKEYQLMRLLIEQPNTSTATLAEMAKIDLEAVKTHLNSNDRDFFAPIFEQYESLSEHLEREAKKAIEYLDGVAKHPNVSVEILEYLAQYPVDRIRFAVAQNPKTPESLRMQLFEGLLERVGSLIHIQIAQDPQTPEFILERFVEEALRSGVNNSVTSIVAALLSNPSVAPILRDRLWEEHQKVPYKDGNYNPYASFRLALASNPSLSERERLEYLEQVLNFSQRSYIDEFFDKPDTPISIWERLAQQDKNVIERLARSWKTPPQFLRQAAELNDVYTLEAVARNPNTPLDVLRNLALNHPKQVREAFFKNPCPDRLGIYQIQLEVEAQEKIDRADKVLTKVGSTSAKGNYALKLEDVREKFNIARNWKTPVLVLEKLAQDPDEKVKSEIARNGNTPIDTLNRLSQDTSSLIRSNVARNPHAPANILERLFSDGDAEVRINLAKNENVPLKILLQLAIDPSETVRIAALCNLKIPEDILFAEIDRHLENAEAILRSCYDQQGKAIRSLPADLLAKLSDSPQKNIRSQIARHPDTPDSVLEKLALDAEESVRRGVAANPSASLELLIEMAKREKSMRYGECGDIVHKSIIARKDATPEALKLALSQKAYTIRCLAAEHPNISVKELEWLIFNETDRLVFDKAINHPKMTADVFRRSIAHTNSWVRALLAKQPNCPTEVLDELFLVELFSNENSINVYLSIAVNPNTSVATLERLVNSTNSEIRIAVASSPTTPLAFLEQLAEDRLARVRYKIAQNPNTPSQIRDRLQESDLLPAFPHRFVSSSLKDLSRIYDPKTDDLADILREYALSDNAFVRLVALLHPMTPIELLEEGGKSLFWLDRYAVAANPATPPEIRQQLTQDSNGIVRAVASNPDRS
jgi:hypothetical protein